MGKKLIIKDADFLANALRESFSINVEDYTLKPGVITISSGIWQVGTNEKPNWYHIEIPVSDLRQAESIVVDATPDKTTPRFGYVVAQNPDSPPTTLTIAFFSSALPNPVINGSTPENVIRIDRIAANTTTTLSIPDDTEYIYVYIGYYNNLAQLTSYIPSMLEALY